MATLPVLAPQSDWIMPTSFPKLSGAKKIAIDLETNDPGLKERGPGWCRKEGHVAGVAVATEQGRWYFPIGHASGPGFDKGAVVRWLQQSLCNPEQVKIMFNAIYDLGWLRFLGVEVKGPLRDPTLAAALLDENRKFYNLDALSKDWLGKQKDEELLRQATLAFGLNDPKADMWKLPAMFVGPYAEQDAELALQLDTYTMQEIAKQDLTSIYELECRLLPVLLDMRSLGVRVDVDAAHKLGKKLELKEKNLLTEVKGVVGFEVDIWSNQNLAEAYKKINIAYPVTEKGNPSFTAAWLESQKDPISEKIVQARKANRVRSTFSSGLILDYATKDGRIHCQFNQLKSDDYGTVSGRMSSSTPNLQQIPVRDEEIGPLVRGIFLPEDGCRWAKHDYSQQEPRLTVHYAYQLNLPGSREAVDYYKYDPKADYHQMIADMAQISRKKAKTTNLGMAYGMGQKKLAASLELSAGEAEEFFNNYHKRVPFVRGLTQQASNLAADRGFIRTLLGRRCRFNKWESADWDFSKKSTPLEDRDQMLFVVEQEIKRARAAGEPVPRGGVRRAFTYRAMNRLIQGSAADMTKKAMVEVHAAGYVPHVQVHDELDTSVQEEKQVWEIKQIMEEVVILAVPVRVDAEVGENWGNVKPDFKW